AVLANDGRQHVPESHASTTFRAVALLGDLIAVVVHLLLRHTILGTQFEEIGETESLFGRALSLDELRQRIVPAVLVPPRVLGRNDGFGGLGFGRGYFRNRVGVGFGITHY